MQLSILIAVMVTESYTCDEITLVQRMYDGEISVVCPRAHSDLVVCCGVLRGDKLGETNEGLSAAPCTHHPSVNL